MDAPNLPITFEEIVIADSQDSVMTYLSSHSQIAYQTFDTNVYYFYPVFISSFSGILSYNKHTKPPTLRFETDDHEIDKLVKSDYVDYRRPVTYNMFKHFIDSLAQHRKPSITKAFSDGSVREAHFISKLDPKWTYLIGFKKNDVIDIFFNHFPFDPTPHLADSLK